VLKGISYDVKSGHKIGIVGRTGCGKSTLALCLSRILEADSGAILIDGKDISKVDLKTLRSKITVIPQLPVIFDGTLRFNLDPTGTIEDAHMSKILKDAGLESLLERKAETK